jgi:hypothetical protein
MVYIENFLLESRSCKTREQVDVRRCIYSGSGCSVGQIPQSRSTPGVRYNGTWGEDYEIVTEDCVCKLFIAYP